MPDQKQSNRIICQGGLDSSQNHLFLSMEKPGSSTNLINYEVGLNGGYRRVNGFTYYDEDFPEVGVGVAEGKVLGIIIFDNAATGITEIIAARKTLGVNEYEFYKYGVGVGWTQIVTGLTKLYTDVGFTVAKLRWDVYNGQDTAYLALVDGVNPATLYDGTNWTEIGTLGTGVDFANAGGDQALDAPELVRFFSKTLFLASDSAFGFKGVVAYSVIEKPFDWNFAAGAGQAIPGFPVQQIAPFRDTLYIFGINAIASATPDVTAGFLVKSVTANMGLVARDALVEIGGDLIFLGPDGFRPVTGTDKIGDVQLEVISKPVQDILNRIVTLGDLESFNSVVIRSKSQFRVFFSDESLEVIDAQGFIGCLRTPDQQTGWEFGKLQGFRVSCVTSRYIGTTEYILHGDFDGKVYRQENGNDLNGTQMFSRYDTPFIDFGDTEIRKVMEKCTVFIRGSGDLQLTCGVVYNWGDPDTTNPSNYIMTITGDPVQYDDGTDYDSGAVYGGILQPLKVQNVEGSCFSIQLRFTTYGSDAPYTMHGIVYEYSPKGRL